MKAEEAETVMSITAEYLFVFLPLVILAIIHIYFKDSLKIFQNNEWSFGAIILFGQSIVKFSCGVTQVNKTIRWQVVSLILSLLIVFGIVPATVLMILLTIHPDSGFWPYASQLFVFLLASFTFYFIGTTGDIFLHGRFNKKDGTAS